jgi:hypothetical protein
MIQDTSLSQEMYLAKHAGADCGGWGLSLKDTYENIDYANIRECSVLWAVSIPGENPWCTGINDEFASKSPPNTTYQSSQPGKFPVPGAAHVGVQVKARNSCPLLVSVPDFSFESALDIRFTQRGIAQIHRSLNFCRHFDLRTVRFSSFLPFRSIFFVGYMQI